MSAVSKVMKQQCRIRNISIIAHVDHGKTALTESLTHVHMDVGEEKERGITIKSAAVSLKIGRIEYDTEEKKEMEKEYLINLIDSPGHVDFSSEVTAALRITDGAICVIDCIEGVCVQTETVLRQAILERVKPVLFINKCDRIWLEKKLPLNDTYKLFRNTISSVNAICETYKDEILGDINMDPTKNNIGFGSGYFGYGFTLSDFAKMYTGKFSISNKKMRKKLWGNNYFDAEQMEWSKQQSTSSKISKSSTNKDKENGFCKYVLKPLKVLHDSIMNGEKEIYEPIIAALGLDIKPKQLKEAQDKKPKDVLRLIMSTWLPAKNCVLDLCADNLPSPVQAQKYRIPKLYTGPMDTQEAQDMLLCNPEGTLSMYVSKMIPIKKDPGRFIAFGRVFSGTIKRGQELRILGQAINGDDGDEKHDGQAPKALATKKRVNSIIMMMGNKPEMLSECPAGNVCGLMGIDKYLTKSGTLADSEQVFPFKTMKFSVSPVVQCAVNVVDSKNLKKLVEGLNRLSKYDNIISITQNKQGQQIVAGSGELHLQTCLTTLKDDFMGGVKINTSQPIVSYMEGINGKSGSTQTVPTNIKPGSKWSYPSIICCKSPDKLNRIYISCEPLSEEVCKAIEADKAPKLRGDMKAFGREFASQFNEWHKDDAARIWSFGTAPYGKCNVLVDQTRAVSYLKEVKGSIIEGFRQITSGGILSDEPLRGVRFNIIDAKIHPDPAHRGPGQIIPATVRASYGALLSASPTMFEPMYSVQIEVPIDSQNGVHNTLGMVRGIFVEMKDKTDIGIPLCSIKAFVPIIETLKGKDINNGKDKKGFTELLREKTKGKAFPVMKFSHWQKVEGDPLIKDSLSNKVIMSIRARKGGMKMDIPQFTDYYDKIN